LEKVKREKEDLEETVLTLREENNQRRELIEHLNNQLANTGSGDDEPEAAPERVEGDQADTELLRERKEEDEEAIFEARLAAEEEITYLKKELFFALAVAIKLNLTIEGKQCNKSVIAIYEAACQQNISYNKWQDWIPSQLIGGA